MGWIEDAAMRDPVTANPLGQIAGARDSGGGMGFDPVSAGIMGVTQIGGAALGGKAQANAQKQAIAFAREQEAARQKRWQQEYEDYKANVSNWNSLRNVLAQRLGIQLPEMTGGGVPASGGGGAAVGGAPAGGGARFLRLADAGVTSPEAAAQEYQGPDYLPSLTGGERGATVADLLNMARA